MPHAEISKSRPPYVIFETRFEEDRNASISAGRLVTIPIDYAIIRSLGAKDSVPVVAEQWLKQITVDAEHGHFPREWVQPFKDKYAAWKKGMDQPLDGFPLREWPAINRAVAENLIGLNLHTVEDLAAAGDDTLSRIGIGSRELQNKARNWMKSASQEGIPAERLTALEARLGDLETANQTLRARNEQLVAELEAMKSALPPPEPETPRKGQRRA